MRKTHCTVFTYLGIYVSRHVFFWKTYKEKIDISLIYMKNFHQIFKTVLDIQHFSSVTFYNVFDSTYESQMLFWIAYTHMVSSRCVSLRSKK